MEKFNFVAAATAASITGWTNVDTLDNTGGSTIGVEYEVATITPTAANTQSSYSATVDSHGVPAAVWNSVLYSYQADFAFKVRSVNGAVDAGKQVTITFGAERETASPSDTTLSDGTSSVTYVSTGSIDAPGAPVSLTTTLDANGDSPTIQASDPLTDYAYISWMTVEPAASGTDTTAPVVTVDPLTTTDTTPTVSGTCDDSTASLSLTVNGVTYTPTVASGSWSQTLNTLAVGSYTMNVTATDAASNQGSATATLTVEAAPPADTVAPVVTIDPLTTTDTTPTVTGTVDDTAATLSLTVDGVTYAPTNSSGSWSQTLNTLAVGVYSMSISATDAANNTGTDTGTLEIQAASTGFVFGTDFSAYADGDDLVGPLFSEPWNSVTTAVAATRVDSEDGGIVAYIHKAGTATDRCLLAVNGIENKQFGQAFFRYRVASDTSTSSYDQQGPSIRVGTNGTETALIFSTNYASQDISLITYNGGTAAVDLNTVGYTFSLGDWFNVLFDYTNPDGSVAIYAWVGDRYQTPATPTTIYTGPVKSAGGIGINTFRDDYTHEVDFIGFADTGETLPRSMADIGGAPVDTTAPTLSNPTATAVNASTANVAVTTDEPDGTLYAVVSTSATTPSVAQVQTGQDGLGQPVPSNSKAVSASGSQSISVAGLSPNTTYYAHTQHKDFAGNNSAVVSSTSFTTPVVTTDPVMETFEGQAVGTLPVGFTSAWAPLDAQVGLKASPTTDPRFSDALGDTSLYFATSGTDFPRMVLKYDGLGTALDSEVTFSVLLGETGSNAVPVLRGSGTEATRTGYIALVRDGTDTLEIRRVEAAASTTIATGSIPNDILTGENLLNVRLRVVEAVGEAHIDLYVWDPAAPEPSTPTLQAIDATPLAAGWQGLGSFAGSSGTAYFGWAGFAIDGAVAPVTTPALGSPTGVTHTVDGTSVTISWNAVSGADRYVIEYRRK